MKLRKRLLFALRYDIEPDFIVVPLGEQYNPVRFTHYADAAKFAKEKEIEYPMYGEPRILVAVKEVSND